MFGCTDGMTLRDLQRGVDEGQSHRDEGKSTAHSLHWTIFIRQIITASGHAPLLVSLQQQRLRRRLRPQYLFDRLTPRNRQGNG